MNGFSLDFVVRNVNGSPAKIKQIYNSIRKANYNDGHKRFNEQTKPDFENEMDYAEPLKQWRPEDLDGEERMIYLKIVDNEKDESYQFRQRGVAIRHTKPGPTNTRTFRKERHRKPGHIKHDSNFTRF